VQPIFNEEDQVLFFSMDEQIELFLELVGTCCHCRGIVFED
jgi:hypothetical protein